MFDLTNQAKAGIIPFVRVKGAVFTLDNTNDEPSAQDQPGLSLLLFYLAREAIASRREEACGTVG
jgi:hypothetical protein